MSQPYRFYCRPCKEVSIWPFLVGDKLFCSRCGVVIKVMNRADCEEFKDEVILLEPNI